MSETEREVILAIIVAILSVKAFYKYKLSVLNTILPLILLFIIAGIIDILLGRFGFFSLFFLVKIITYAIIGQSVYDLTLGRIKTLLVLCCGILAAQLAVYLIDPSFFAASGRAIGVEDPFTLYGDDRGRISLAYFQPNIAAHSLFFFFLSWLGVHSAGVRSKITLKYGVGLAFVGFALLTGSRAFIVLILSFLLSRMFINKSRLVLASITFIPFLIIFFLPIQSAIADLYLLREESNTARLEAIQTYIQYISDAPILGKGYENLRYYAEVLEGKPSHVLFIELLAAYGIFLGSIIILWLVYILILRASSTSLAHIGFFALATGFFSNTILFVPTFFPFVVPVLLKLTSLTRSKGAAEARGDSAAAYPGR